MNLNEAHQILGIAEGASEAERQEKQQALRSLIIDEPSAIEDRIDQFRAQLADLNSKEAARIADDRKRSEQIRLDKAREAARMKLEEEEKAALSLELEKERLENLEFEIRRQEQEVAAYQDRYEQYKEMLRYAEGDEKESIRAEVEECQQRLEQAKYELRDLERQK